MRRIISTLLLLAVAGCTITEPNFDVNTETQNVVDSSFVGINPHDVFVPDTTAFPVETFDDGSIPLLNHDEGILVETVAAGRGNASDKGKQNGKGHKKLIVDKVVVSPTTLGLKVGQTGNLSALALNVFNRVLENETITWQSLNPSVATVTQTGTVTAVAVGTAVIQATADGKIGTATVTVTPDDPPPPPPPAPVATVEVVPVLDTLDIGDAVDLTATAKDAAGNVLTGRVVTWATSASTIATVATNGTVTAVSGGTATITATSEGKTGTATIVVLSPPPPPPPTPVATVTVSPQLDTLLVGATRSLIAVAKSANDSVLTGRTVTWSSGTPSVATVSNLGVVTAVAAGTATITATSEGKTGTATIVVVLPPPAPVATLTVSPATNSIEVGGTVSLIAVAKDANGNILTGRPVSWSSGTTAIATVSGTGVVTGVAAGTATITATSEGKTGTATVTVTAPPVQTGLANECQQANPAWIFCDDFDVNRLDRYFEVDNAGGRFNRLAGAGNDGSFGMRGVYTTAQQTSSGSLKLAFGKTPGGYIRSIDAGTIKYREVYWRVYVRNQPGWTGGGGDKLSRATSLVNSNWAQAMSAHVWSGGANNYYLTLDPASGTDVAGNLRTTRYNDFNNMRWLGEVAGTNPLFAPASIGQWHCVEAHVKWNDAGSSNGIFEYWINDQLNVRLTTLNWVGAYNDYGMNAIFLENYWNNGSPVQQYRDLDNFVVSTQRIGCNSTTTPPPPPPGPDPIATLTVSPQQATLTVGETTSLIAVAKDANGNTLTGRPVTWSTSSSSVATVSGTGVVTGVAAGTATITATSEGKTGTSAITVTAPPPPPPEPSNFVSNLPTDKGLQLIVDTRFGEGKIKQNAYGTDGLKWENSSPSIGRNITVADAPYGPDVFEMTYPGNDAGNGTGGARIIGPNCDGRSGGSSDPTGECFEQGKRWTRIYTSMMVWVPANYSMHTNAGTEKWLYNWTTDGTNRSALVIQWGALSAGANGPTFGLYFYPQAPSLTVTPQTGTERVVKGQWNRLEVYIQLNSPNKADGEYRAWINGQLVHSVSNFLYRNGSNQWYFDGILFDGTRGGGASSVLTPPEGQSRRYSRMAFYASEVLTTPPPPPPPAASSINLAVVRIDSSRTDSVIVSSGLPFKKGAIQPSDVANFRMVVDGAEIPLYATALKGRYNDGSVRSVLLQFATTPAKAALGARLDLTGRTLPPRAGVVPTGSPTAMVRHQNLSDYIATGIVGTTQTRALSPTSPQYFVDYENRFDQYEQSLWSTTKATTTMNYYDRTLAYFGFWARTGNPRFFARGANLTTRYREEYIKPANYFIPEWNNHVEGTSVHYLLTGDPESLLVIERLATRIDTYATNAMMADLNHEWMDNRIQSRILMTKVLAIRLGYTGTPAYGGSPAISDLKAAALADVNAILSTQGADGAFRFRVQGYENSNFMTGILNDALGAYYDEVSPDPRVLESVKKSHNFLMTTQWKSANGGFQYYSGTGSSSYVSGDLNGMFMSYMAWLYDTTNDSAIRTHGEDVFREGVRNAYLVADKQFNQWYMNSWRWLGVR